MTWIRAVLYIAAIAFFSVLAYLQHVPCDPAHDGILKSNRVGDTERCTCAVKQHVWKCEWKEQR